MKCLNSSRYALTRCVAAAMLVGCGGSQPPIGAPGAMPQASRIPAQADHGRSWMLPGTSGDLLYVGCGGVCIYTYPGSKAVGTLKVYPNSLCSDEGGNVFITSSVDYGKGVIYEYPHGGTEPTQTIGASD